MSEGAVDEGADEADETVGDGQAAPAEAIDDVSAGDAPEGDDGDQADDGSAPAPDGGAAVDEGDAPAPAEDPVDPVGTADGAGDAGDGGETDGENGPEDETGAGEGADDEQGEDAQDGAGVDGELGDGQDDEPEADVDEEGQPEDEGDDGGDDEGQPADLPDQPVEEAPAGGATVDGAGDALGAVGEVVDDAVDELTDAADTGDEPDAEDEDDEEDDGPDEGDGEDDEDEEPDEEDAEDEDDDEVVTAPAPAPAPVTAAPSTSGVRPGGSGGGQSAAPAPAPAPQPVAPAVQSGPDIAGLTQSATEVVNALDDLSSAGGGATGLTAPSTGGSSSRPQGSASIADLPTATDDLDRHDVADKVDDPTGALVDPNAAVRSKADAGARRSPRQVDLRGVDARAAHVQLEDSRRRRIDATRVEAWVTTLRVAFADIAEGRTPGTVLVDDAVTEVPTLGASYQLRDGETLWDVVALMWGDAELSASQMQAAFKMLLTWNRDLLPADITQPAGGVVIQIPADVVPHR